MRNIRRHLRFRVLLPLLLLGGIIAGIGVWIIQTSFTARLEAQIISRAQVMARDINYAAEAIGNVRELQRFVAAVGADPDVLMISVAAGNPSRIIASTKNDWIGLSPGDLPTSEAREELLHCIATGANNRRFYHARDKEVLVLTSPLLLYTLQFEKLSTGSDAIVLQLDASTMRQQLATTAQTLAALLVCVVAILTLLTYTMLSRLVLKPAHAISDAMARRAAGDAGVFAPELSHDEIGGLAGTLNNMLRTLDAKELEVQKAREAAVAGDIAKSEFLANMSHEIRTPMTAILGFVETLLEPDQSKEERYNAIRTIRRNGEHLLGLINDILDLSKIDAGKMTIDLVRCSPCDIIGEVAALMQIRANAKQIAFNTEYVGFIPQTIQTDPMRLRQILINLIGNAIKFTNEGGVRLVTKLVQLPNCRQYPDSTTNAPPGATPAVCPLASPEPLESFLQFDVVDTGVGIKPEQVDKLFKPFAQSDSSTARKFGGTGLGLTISKHFAERLGGHISIVDTGSGVGTCFRTVIATGSLDSVRMLNDPATACVIAAEKSMIGHEPTPRLDCRVLLAEDGADNQRLIGHLLRKAGAEVTIVDDGAQAVTEALGAVASDRPYDLILMDMQMPIMDGYQASTRLRAEGYDLPIIALTAHAMASDREKCIAAGCNDYATKPINRTTLFETIRRYLGE